MSDAIELWPKDMVERARRFAHAKHDEIGQKRKYTGEPYWVHTDEVAEIVKAHGGTEYMQAAAHLHDTLEDTKTTAVELIHHFPIEIVSLVIELTDKFTSENYPELNRKQRKKLEAEKWKSPAAQTIKLSDLFSNTKSIVEHDPGFAKVYLEEKEYALQFLKGGNPKLWEKVNQQLIEAKKKLAVTE